MIRESEGPEGRNLLALALDIVLPLPSPSPSSESPMPVSLPSPWRAAAPLPDLGTGRPKRGPPVEVRPDEGQESFYRRDVDASRCALLRPGRRTGGPVDEGQ